MKRKRLYFLLKEHIGGTLTQEEADELQTAIDDPELSTLLEDAISSEFRSDEIEEFEGGEERDLLPGLETEVWKRIKTIRRRKRWMPVASVSAAIFVSVGVMWWFGGFLPDNRTGSINTPGENISADAYGAILEFPNGRVIELEDGHTNIEILDRQIQYADGTPLLEEIDHQWVQMSVPSAAQYGLTLPDGTRIWINALSTLRYPVSFDGLTRTIELEGEAYFEVAHDAERPFFVKSGDQTLKVLGTSFNVRAYGDEASVETTLVEGEIVLKSSREMNFYPLAVGDRAVLRNGDWNIEPVDVTNYTSWKDGLIIFHEADLAIVLRQIERWYGVEFDFGSLSPSDRPVETIDVELDRTLPLSKVLEGLQIITSYDYIIKGRRIMVY